MAYFGDSLAHSALLGVALGVISGAGVNLGVLAVCVLFAALLVVFEHQRRLGMDALLGIFAHGALALGLVALSFTGQPEFDLEGFLVGDILSVGAGDLGLVFGGSILVLLGLGFIWRTLLSLSVHEEMTAAEGQPVLMARLVFMGLMALFVMIALKVVGVLLISSLLIIPAASARQFARSPEQMAVTASLLGGASVLAGLGAHGAWQSPAGPSIVVAAVCFFAISQVWQQVRQK
jgi:zinc transport system permease protein